MRPTSSTLADGCATCISFTLLLSLMACVGSSSHSEVEFRGEALPLVDEIGREAADSPLALAGRGWVDASGQAAYEMALAVPPGRAGVAPELRLRYSSAAGDGPFGPGFVLDGAFSSVRRCGKSLGTDGELDGVRFDARDRVCLDGKRLVGPREDTEYWAPGAVYQEELAAWNRILLETSPERRFVVQGRDGTRRIYGGGSATVRAPRGDRDASGELRGAVEVEVAWALARVEDASGNYVAFEYETDRGEDGAYAHRLLRIRYTGLAGAETLSPEREIRLVYEDRETPASTFFAGTHHRRMQRVAAIEAWVRDTLARRYTLRYAADAWSGTDVLASIRECGPEGGCRPETHFGWTHPEWSEVRRHTLPAAISPFHRRLRVVAGDFNGDGRDDILSWDAEGAYFKRLFAQFGRRALGAPSLGPPREIAVPVRTTAGGRDPVAFFTVLPAVDGDRVLFRSDVDGKPWSLTRWTDTGFEEEDPSLFDCAHHIGWAEGSPPVVGDFDGDGAADASHRCIPGLTEAPEEAPWLHSVAHFDEARSGSAGSGVWSTERSASEPLPARRWVFDTDGDGKTEVIGLAYDAARAGEVLTTAPEGLRPLVPVGTPAADVPPIHLPYHGTHVIADLNGDGLADVASHEEDGIYVRLNTGRGLTRATLALPATAETSARWGRALREVAHSALRVGDFDRDGRQDLLVLLPLRSEGVGLAVLLRYRAGRLHAEVEWPMLAVAELDTLDWSAAQLLDVDGDGQLGVSSLIDPRDAPRGLEVIEPRLSARPTALVAVDDGHSNPRFTYADLSSQRIEERVQPMPRACPAGEECVPPAPLPVSCAHGRYPNQCYVRGRWVAAGVVTDDGAGGEREVEYRYGVAYRDVRRRADLGFDRVLAEVHVAGAPERIDTRYDLTQIELTGESAQSDVAERRSVWARRALQRDIYRYPDVTAEESHPPRHARVSLERRRETWELQPSRIAGAYRALRRESQIFIYDDADYANERDSLGLVGHASLEGRPALHHTRTERTHDEWGSVLVTRTEDVLSDRVDTVTRSLESDPDSYLIGLPRAVLDERTEGPTARRRSVVMEYDEHGRLIRVAEGVPPAGAPRLGAEPASAVETRWTYDAYGNLAARVTRTENPDPESVDEEPAWLERSLRWEYDAREHLLVTAETNALGHRTRYSRWPDTGDVACLQDAAGVEQIYVYDDFGELVAHRHEGVEDRLGWAEPESGGCYARHITPEGAPTRTTTFDCLDHPVVIRETWADGRSVWVERRYDAAGRLVMSTEPAFDSAESAPRARMHYDGSGRLREREGADGSTESWRYEGRVVVHTNAHGGESRVGYDSLGRRAWSQEGDEGPRTTYRYEASDAPSGIERAGHETAVTYDWQGSVVEVKHPDAGRRLYRRNGFGELEGVESAVGRRDFDYDAAGRLRRVMDADGAMSEWLYDTPRSGLGRLDSALRRDAIAVADTFEYDDYGRVARRETSVEGVVASVQTEYEGAQLAARIYEAPDEAPLRVDWERDGSGFVDAVRAEGEVVWRAEARDDPWGRATRERRLGVEVERRFDAAVGRVAEVRARRGGATVATHRYTYIARGALAAREDERAGARVEYDYDERGRLIAERSSGGAGASRRYAYDVHGNQTRGATRDRRFDRDGRPHTLDEAEGVGYEYDELGRRVGSTAGWSAEYTAFDLPRGVYDADGQHDYAYDAFETRVAEQDATGQTLTLGELQQHVHGGERETRLRIHVGGEAVVELRRRGDVIRRFALLESPLGTSGAAVEERGDVERAPALDAFGAPLGAGAPESRLSSELRFAGHAYEGDRAGLINMRGRLYDARNATFVSPDPLWETEGPAANAYHYALWNPLQFVDPSGLQAEGPPDAGYDFFSAEGGYSGPAVVMSAPPPVEEASPSGAPRAAGGARGGAEEEGEAWYESVGLFALGAAEGFLPFGEVAGEWVREQTGIEVNTQSESYAWGNRVGFVAGALSGAKAAVVFVRNTPRLLDGGRRLVNGVRQTWRGMREGASRGARRLSRSARGGGGAGGAGVRRARTRAACFAAGTLVAVWGSLPAEARALSAKGETEKVSAGAPPQGTPSLRPIESLRVGMRVATAHQVASGAPVEAATDVDATWRVFSLRSPDGGVRIEALRPAAWRQQVDPDGDARVEALQPELGIGAMDIVAQAPAPTVLPGPGHVVLTTYARREAPTLTLHWDRGPSVITTPGHRFRSLDRRSWAAASALRIGEAVDSGAGPVRLAGRSRSDETSVFNFEVEGVHEYLVGEQLLRVHNNDCDDVADGAATASASRGGGAIRLPAFTETLVDDVVATAGRARGATTEGARALGKKLGRAQSRGYTSAFDGIAPTQANAEAIIRSTLANPSRTVIGRRTVDVYNASGQGVRFNAANNCFVGFLEDSLATR